MHFMAPCLMPGKFLDAALTMRAMDRWKVRAARSFVILRFAGLLAMNNLLGTRVCLYSPAKIPGGTINWAYCVLPVTF